MLKQSLLQKLNQTLSPQQLTLIKLLSIPTIDLEQRIKEELEQNPALDESADFDEDGNFDEDYEVDAANSREDFDLDPYLDDDEIPSYKTNSNNYGEEITYQIEDLSKSLTDALLEQFSFLPLNLDETDLFICHYIIGNLDEDGFLTREVEAITDDLSFRFNISATDAKVLECLKHVQKLEPVGIGALSLSDALAMQINRLPKTKATSVALNIVNNHFEDFVKHNHHKIFRKINPDFFKLGKAIIEKLNPSPASVYNLSNTITRTIIPDFYLIDDDGNLSVSLNDRNNVVLSINKDYKEMLNTYKRDVEAQNFVKGKVNEAQWFIDALHLRTLSMMMVMEAILKRQYAYLSTGDKTLLKPLILKDIAEAVNLDISTVSRIASQKYIDTPYGVLLLKQLFLEAIDSEGDKTLTQNIVFEKIEHIINNENKSKPFTDDKIQQILEKDHHISLSRRTISKYREQLNIPPTKFRKIT